MAALTSSERRFLELFIRTDVEEERRSAYRDCHCGKSDGCEATVTKAINALTGRRDAQLYIAGAQRRLEYETARSLQATDEMAFDRTRAVAAADRAAIELYTVTASRSDLKPTEAAKLIESGARYGFSQVTASKGMTAEQRKAAVARMTRTSADATASTPQMPAKDGPIGIA